MDHELETLDKFIEETQTKLENRRQLRETNQNIRDNTDHYNEITPQLQKLDSSIKKNSAFVKRLKAYTENQKDQVLNEIDRLNLTKFISEVAASIIEAKLKLSDIPSVIEICSKINKTYRDFGRILLEQYAKSFPTVAKRKNHQHYHHNDQFTLISAGNSSSFSGSGGNNYNQSPATTSSQANNSTSLISRVQSKTQLDVSSINPSKIRVDLRLFAELILSGVFPVKESFPMLVNLLCYLMFYDKCGHQNANAILTFCKGCGDELLGLVPRKMQQLAMRNNRDIPASHLIPIKGQELLRNYLSEYYSLLIKYVDNLHHELNELISKNNRIYKSKGELTKDLKELTDSKNSEFQKFQSVIQPLADLLGEDIPSLPDVELCREEAKDSAKDADINLVGSSSILKQSLIWDDEGTRSFYEDLIDLTAYFPNLVVRASLDQFKAPSQAMEKTPGEAESAEKDIKDNESGSRESTPTKSPEGDADDSIRVSSPSSSEESLTEIEPSANQSGRLTMVQAVANRVQPDQYFVKLSNSVNRDMIDNAAIDFMRFFNTKFGRKKLIKTLFNVQRTRLDLLPFFARLTATIYRYVPSIGNELVALLKQDFRSLFRKKDQINIESKVKNVRFIGELVKFNLYSKQEALVCLRLLLSDFTHHHIEMSCNLLETCGRLLYNSPESHHQIRLILEQMMRKKLLLSVDSKYITMIENAYYFTNPPEVVEHVIDEPPVHIYVRYLLCECLNRSTIDNVLQKIKKLDWNDKKLAKFVINCMIGAYNLKFYNIRYLAALLAALNKEHQWISVAVVDGVVEDILLMMELNELHFNQRRIPMIRYFGELYNYRLSDSSLVFKILYSLITYGVNYPEPDHSLTQVPLSQLDSPDNLFRVKLVCDLLDTCGQYLSSGQEKKKLDCYMLFFQRYYWCKKHIYMLHPYCMAKSGNQFPASVEYLYNDTIYNLRPNFQMATSYAEAIQVLQSFIDNLIANQSSSTSSS